MTRQAKPRRVASRMGFRCWRCGSRATCIRQSQVSPILMEAGYRCSNLDCGHAFVGAIEAIRTLCAGSFAAPAGINVPMSKHVQRAQLLTELQLAPEARGGGMEADTNLLPTQLDLLASPGLQMGISSG
jgi:hypothetical protein